MAPEHASRRSEKVQGAAPVTVKSVSENDGT